MSGNGSAFSGASVDIKTTYDGAALRQAISDFRDGKISATDLKSATDQVKSSYQVQNQALRALNTSYRVNNFQLLQGMSILRSATSMFRDLNSVYQTLTLKAIDVNTETVAQQQNFDTLKTSVSDVANELSVLGSNNTDVSTGFSDILSKASSLSSTDIGQLVNQVEQLKQNGTWTPDELKSLSNFEAELKQVQQETIQKDDATNMQNYVQAVTTLGLTASSIGTFVLNLSKITSAVRILNSTLAASPYILAFIAALQGGAELGNEINNLTGNSRFNPQNSYDQYLKDAGQTPPGSKSIGQSISDFLANPAGSIFGDLNINITGPISANSPSDIQDMATKVAKQIAVTAGSMVK